jgi:hypothetical protein
MQQQQQPRSEVTPLEPEILHLLDAAVEVSGQGVAAAAALGRRVGSAGRPVVHLALRPPVLSRRRHPASWLDQLSRRGGLRRAEVARRLSPLLDAVVRGLVEQVLRRVDATDLIHTYVDLDEVISDVDIEAVVSRVDIVTLVKEVIDELDLPEMVRESTSAMASESVRGLRMHSISGDDAIGRAVARVRSRRAVAATVTPSPDGSPGHAGTSAP